MPSFLEVTVEKDDVLDISEMDVRLHSGVLLDGVADSLTLKRNRECLQGRPKLCRGGRSATMIYSYPFTFCRRAVVATLDDSAENLELFYSDHWLANEKNCIVLRLTEPAWQQPVSSVRPAADLVTPLARMRAWTAKGLRSFLESRDMVGPAGHLFAQAMNGEDFAELTETEFVHKVKVTPFAARKLARLREAFLSDV